MNKDGFWDTIGDTIDSAVIELLSDQPYEAKCTDCGEKLQVAKCAADTDFDQFLTIVPCKHCIAKAAIEAAKGVK